MSILDITTNYCITVVLGVQLYCVPKGLAQTNKIILDTYIDSTFSRSAQFENVQI